MTITAAEQLLLELTNRARLDPLAEAERFGINLNSGLSAGTITSDVKQALAFNMDLSAAATGHSLWMLQADQFSHTGRGGSSIADRILDTDYTFNGYYGYGENLSWSGTTGQLDSVNAVFGHHENLFLSAGHRRNTMQDRFQEAGFAIEEGIFSTGRDYNASMVTEKFAYTGTDVFITGVVYQDTDKNAFYSVGEGRGGVEITGQGNTVSTMDAGGYAIAVEASPNVWVDLGQGRALMADASDGNVKIDLVNGNTVMSSGSIDLISGLTQATLLGAGDIDVEGSVQADRLTGNRGRNEIFGGDGNDVIHGKQGNDNLKGGSGADVIEGGNGNDVIHGGNGRDRIYMGNGDDVFFDNGQGGFLGEDVVFAGFGNDRIQGGNGNDIFHGMAGNDVIYGRLGDDVIFAGTGFDTVFAGDGNDVVRGGDGRDQIFLGNGDDLFIDTAQGGFLGADRVFAGNGNDTIQGGNGDDSYFGMNGDDMIMARLGNDWINGGAGADVMVGGVGADTFVFEAGHGNDRITDFDINEDILRLDDALTGGRRDAGAVISTYASVENGAVVLDFGNGNEITLNGVTSTSALIDDLAFF